CRRIDGRGDTHGCSRGGCGRYTIDGSWNATASRSSRRELRETTPMFGGLVPRAKAQAPFVSIEEALEETRRGRMVILMDDEDRENEGDLCMAAEKVTPEAINFMTKHGRGLICLSLTPQRVEDLKLPMMTDNNTSSFGTAFTV